MRHILVLFSLPLLLAAGPEPIRNTLPATVKAKLASADKEFLKMDCDFLAYLYNPKDSSVTPLGICIYTETQSRGIFAAFGCVGVLVEPEAKVKNPFYGKNGHWGAEGKCSKEPILKLFAKPDTLKTVNPVTSFKMKRKEGQDLRILKDELGIAARFREMTGP